MISVQSLVKRFGSVEAVKGVSLEIAKGEIFALLGVNGAGKTTLIRMLTGLLRPDAGDAFLGGHSILTEAGEVKKIIGLSPQENAVGQNLTVYENLFLMAGVSGFSKKEAHERCEKMLADFSLSDIKDRRAGKLSGGWQRRLSLAMAVITQPEILFLDEPTVGLDVLARRELWNVIEGLRGKITMVLTTHSMEEAEALSDRIGIMKAGRLLTVDTAKGLMEKTGAKRFEDAFVSVIGEDGA